MTPTVTLSETHDKGFAEFLQTQIREFNNAASPHHLAARQPGAVKPLNIIVKNEAGQVVGGLSGSVYWDWFEIDHFFIPATMRRQGLGTTILQMAEHAAIQCGARHSFLSTFAFQARAFYEKQGYIVVGQLDDYPLGSAYFWMRKDFEL